jgi:C-terminal processing protease CtpA/Prc
MGENTRHTPDEVAANNARAALGASFDSEGQYEKDPSIKEEIIEIFAPAGKLGVVIDTPDDGAPVVHAVKDSSIIAHQIRVGDKLVAVDDQDVTAMTAIKVSKLISKKSANPQRKLTVIRSSLLYDAEG